jgi:hypothetical protein
LQFGRTSKQNHSTDCNVLTLGNWLTFRWDANPVEVASQLLRDVSLTPGRKAHHDNHCGGVGQLWPTGWKEQSRKERSLKWQKVLNRVLCPVTKTFKNDIKIFTSFPIPKPLACDNPMGTDPRVATEPFTLKLNLIFQVILGKDSVNPKYTI